MLDVQDELLCSFSSTTQSQGDYNIHNPHLRASAAECGYLERCLFSSGIEPVMQTSRKRVPLLLMALEYTTTAESLSDSVFRIDTVTKLTALCGIFGQIICISLRKKNVSDRGNPLVFSNTINLLLLPTEVEDSTVGLLW